MTAYGGGVVEEDGITTTVTFDKDQTLVYAEDSNDYGRTAQHWWAGIHIDMPAGVELEAGKTTYVKVGNWWEDDGEKEDLWTAAKTVQEDGQYWAMARPTYMTLFGGEAGQLIQRYKFDWDGDGDFDQYVTIIIKDTVKFAEHPYVKDGDKETCQLCGKAHDDSVNTDTPSDGGDSGTSAGEEGGEETAE